MGNFDTTQDDPVAVAEGMDIESRADTGLSGHCRRHPFRTPEVFLRRYLEIFLGAGHKRNSDTGMFRHSRVVGQFQTCRCPVGRQYFTETESLRCLRPPDVLSVDGGRDYGRRPGAPF